MFPHISACSSAKKFLNFCLVTVSQSRVINGFIVGLWSAEFFFLYRILSEQFFCFWWIFKWDVDLFFFPLKDRVIAKRKKKEFLSLLTFRRWTKTRTLHIFLNQKMVLDTSLFILLKLCQWVQIFFFRQNLVGANLFIFLLIFFNETCRIVFENFRYCKKGFFFHFHSTKNQ